MDSEARIPSKMATKFLKLNFFLLIISLCLSVIYFQFKTVSIDHDRLFLIKRGTPAYKVVNQLYDDNVIPHKYFANILIKFDFVARNIKPGCYQLTSKDDLYSIFFKFISGDAQSMVFKIIPGFNADDIKNLISEHSNIKNDKPEIKEGMYYPDSYFYDLNQPLSQILENAEATMENKVNYYWKNRLLGLPIHTPNELIIVASLIEKESSDPNERKKIARVIYNRLDQKIPLQFCSSILYILKENRPLKFSDLKIESPYNTYRHKGLPPSPISYPDESSLEAAAFPDDGDQIYFVLQPNGNHFFTNDFDQHKKNKHRTTAN